MIDPHEFDIQTEVAPAYYNHILDFIYKYYLFPQPDAFSEIKKSKKQGKNYLDFIFTTPDKMGQIKGTVKSGEKIKVKLVKEGEISPEILDKLAEDIFIAVQIYEESVRQSTIYLAWVEGQKIIPEKPPTLGKKTSKKLFGSNLLVVYLIFFGINITLFLLFDLYLAVIFIIGIQLAIVLLSDKIFMKMADWEITPENPNIHIIQYQLPEDEYKFFKKALGKNALFQIKKEIYENTLAQGIPPNCKLGEEVFSKYGFHCKPLQSSYKAINVYDIVKEAAEKFDLNVPRIIINNNLLPNAAATGPSPKRGLVLITTGLLVQLNEEEVLSVVGHEMGHLVGRDPIILFSLISGEFILRLTVLLPIVIINPIIYLIVALGSIFFVAKFFEARADLLSAMKIGKPQVLAEALRKIGYQKLQFERMTSQRISSWAIWDPHPPIYFRIKRLENMKKPDKIQSPLIQSARDVFSGFKDVFKK